MKRKTYQVTMLVTTVEPEDADGTTVIYDLLQDSIMEQVLPDPSNLPVAIESSSAYHVEMIRSQSSNRGWVGESI